MAFVEERPSLLNT